MKQIIAHRGASAYAPENTMASMNEALNLGSRFVEFDVMLSADGQPFIIHDHTLKRTTNGSGEFGLVDAQYIQSLDAGYWFSKRYQGEKIPSFENVLQWLLAFDVQADIEIKPYPGATEKTTIEVLACINRHWPRDKKLPLVSSFDLDALSVCRGLSPEMPLGLLLHKWHKDWLKRANELRCYSVHLSLRAATRAHIEEIKANGFKVFVYVVNQKRLALKLMDWGVDAVFSDYPDLLGTAHVSTAE